MSFTDVSQDGQAVLELTLFSYKAKIPTKQIDIEIQLFLAKKIILNIFQAYSSRLFIFLEFWRCWAVIQKTILGSSTQKSDYH